MGNVRKPQAPQTNTDAVAVLGLLLLATVPYLNTITNTFVYDDKLQVLDNPYVHSFRYIGKVFGSTVWTWEGAQGVTNYYRPLMTLAYLICYKLFGPIPFGFHLAQSRSACRGRGVAFRGNGAAFWRSSSLSGDGGIIRSSSDSHGISRLDCRRHRPGAEFLFSADVSLLFASRPAGCRRPGALAFLHFDARELCPGSFYPRNRPWCCLCWRLYTNIFIGPTGPSLLLRTKIDRYGPLFL